ncbi:MAG: M48 family metalloprotease [Gammaproteobacteria bacterium]|nr:M48 family metalloprotease [Gammaproteobacteria bacterium]
MGAVRGWFAAILLALVTVGCAVNPVTGEKELHLVSESSEIDMGRKNYRPTQQTQGGRYVVDPELSRYVNKVGQRLAKVSDRPGLPYEFVVLNNSVPNAWAMPGGKIALNRGLLVELQSEAELAAVLGHEIVHAAARHGAKAMERGMLLQAGMIGAGVALSDSDNANLWLGAAAVGANLINQRYGREHELESDRYGTLYMSRAGYDPKAAVDLQQTFVRLHEGKKTGWLEGLFASHPPSEERVRANRRHVAKLPAGGRMGREEYRRRLGVLKQGKEAYAAYDKGRKALGKKDSKQALRLADRAIGIESREALFYGLRGDALSKQGRFNHALGEYGEALSRNSDYFQFYLGRGLAERELGMDSAARRDLEQSNKLLPTAPAHYGLGELALANRQTDVAVKHFRAAAGSNSAVGRKAAASMVRLELPRTPGKYIRVRLTADKQGNLQASVVNKSPVAVRNVAVRIGLVQGRRVLEEERLLVRSLRAGQGQRVRPRLKSPAANSKIRVVVKVEAAELAE